MDLEIAGRIALVTGADSGIGLETARMLLEAGCRVAITDKTHEPLEQARSMLASHGEVIAVTADVTDTIDVSRLFASVYRQLGNPDILVNAAGVTGATGDFLSVDERGWLETLDINLLGAVRMCRAAIPGMRGKGWGRIVMLASEDGVQPYVDELPYCASKAGILSLSKGLSKAYGRDNILVNAVSPAFIATPMTDAMMDERARKRRTTREEAIESLLKEERPGMVRGRRGKPEEVAAMIAFLCSERAGFITGANMRVDAGSVMTI